MDVGVLPRQIAATSIYGCGYDYDYNNIDNCESVLAVYPTCYDYYADQACCNTWLSWEYGYLNCLQTAYSNCFDFTAYESEVSGFLPCYTNHPYTAPNTVPATTTASVPSLIFESISTTTPTSTPPHSAISSYTGAGDLLQGYCATPDYVLLDGPTAYWAPVVGCNNDKTDCCPYAVNTAAAATATAVTVVSTVTVNIGPSAITQQPYTGLQAYPVAASPDQATLAHCPADYAVVSGGCCPSGYLLWNAPIAGQTPCYSSLSSYLVPPAVPVTPQTPMSVPITSSEGSLTAVGSVALPSSSPSSEQKPTSAIINIVYAVAYPVQVVPPQGLSTGAKAGIGAGAGVAGIAIIALSILLVWRTRKHKKYKEAVTASQTTGADSTGQSQTPGSYVPQDQNGYLPPQQMQYGPGYYEQQPVPPMVEMQGQPGTHYPSPPLSSVSPAQGSDGYSHQTGYPPPSTASPPPGSDRYSYYTGPPPPSTTSPPPGSDGYVHQNGYSAPAQEMYSPERRELQGQSYHPERQELQGQPPGEMSA